MSNIIEIIPVKSQDIDILPYDGPGYLIVHKKLQYNLKVNQLVVDVLDMIDGKKNIEQISSSFSETFGKELSATKVYELLFKKLGRYHIIENDDFEYTQVGKPDYLKLSFTVLKKEWIKPLIKQMVPLFSRSLFYPALILSLFSIALIGVVHYDVTSEGIMAGKKDLNVPFMVFVSAITIFMHEFGHIAACDYYKVDHGDVGFGFYLLSPVMYADVSNIWKLKRKERIVVNLGGLYIQILIAFLFGILFLVFGKVEFLALMYMLGIISVCFNLNPLFRTDGYWILSDFTGVYNLRERSNQCLLKFFGWVSGKEHFDFKKENVLLTLYALVSMSYIFVFIAVLLINDFYAFLHFPVDFIQFIKDWVFNWQRPSVSAIDGFMIYTLLYFLLFKLALRKLKKIRVRIRNT